MKASKSLSRLASKGEGIKLKITLKIIYEDDVSAYLINDYIKE
jgi:hypothetical protein